MLNTGNIYLHKILGITFCWTLWEDLFTQNTGDYFMLSTVGKFIYTKYWRLLYVEHCGKIYLHKILEITLRWTLWEDLFTQNTVENCMWNTVGRFIYTKYRGIMYVEHCGDIYLNNILGITLWWALWEYLFTQNTEEYCMLSTVGRFIYTKYQGILYVEHCGKIYLHKILRNTLCWALWDLFTQNTQEYFMLSTVGRFIYTKYWGILYAKHCEKIYLHKILRNTVYWALWEDLFTHNTGDYFLLNTVGIFIYIKYWEILYVEHWENLFTQNTGDYFMLNTVGRFIYTKYWGILYVEHCGKIYLHKIQRNNVCLSTVGK
jgi:hypothetical protein